MRRGCRKRVRVRGSERISYLQNSHLIAFANRVELWCLMRRVCGSGVDSTITIVMNCVQLYWIHVELRFGGFFEFFLDSTTAHSK